MQPFNKYYPPDWTPDKGTVNQFVGKHPLGDRARKIDQGILVVRFELPFNIWCTGCDNHIGKGVRYNAEKKKIGNYYSTPILQFRMRCHLCSNWIEIQTDPKNTAYVVVSGAKKKVEEWEPEDTEVIRLQDEDTKEKLESDPIYRLEHGIKDEKILDQSKPHLTQLQDLNDALWKDPYARSQALRRKFREEKKKDKAIQEKTERLRDKHSLQIELLPEDPADQIQAKLMTYADPASSSAEKMKLEKTASPLFASNLSHSIEDNPAKELGFRASMHTRLKTDPFLKNASFSKLKQKKQPSEDGSSKVTIHLSKRKRSTDIDENNDSKREKGKSLALVTYESDSDG